MRLRSISRTLCLFTTLFALGATAVVPAAAEEAYVEVTEHWGYVSYAAAWHLAPAGADCVAHDAFIHTVKNCGGIRSGSVFTGEVIVPVTESVHTVVVELVYDPTVPTNSLQLDLLCPDVPRGASGAVLDMDHDCYFVTDGGSYLQLRVDKVHWEEHGYTNIGDWSARVFATGALGTRDDVGIDAGLTVEQPFDMYVSLFHHAPAPEDYSAVL